MSSFLEFQIILYYSKKLFPMRLVELVHNTGFEELWTGSLRVKAAPSAVGQVKGPAFEEVCPHVIVSLDSVTAARLRN